MTTQEFIDTYNPCNEARRSDLAQYTHMSDVWDNCSRVDWLFWIHEKHSPLTKPQAVTLAIKFAEECNHTDQASIDCMNATKAWLSDQTEENRLAAAAWSAAAWSAAAAVAAWSVAAAAWSAASRSAFYASAAARSAEAAALIFKSTITNPFK